MNAVAADVKLPILHFPSRAWFEQLASLMNSNRPRQEQLGYMDCIAQFTVLDGGTNGGPCAFRVAFEEFSALSVVEVATRDVNGADFALEATHATWREMIESIAKGHGRPDLEHSLNRLSHMGTPMKLIAEDSLRADLYFRFNQSLQEFINASVHIDTRF